MLVETARKFDQARSSFTYLIPLALLRLQPLEHRRVIPVRISGVIYPSFGPILES